MILNEIERAVICGKQKYRTNADFIDAIEAAVIAKLAQGVDLPEPDVHPDAWAGGFYSRDRLTTAIAAARVKALEEASVIAERHEEGSGGHQAIRALKGGAA